MCGLVESFNSSLQFKMDTCFFTLKIPVRVVMEFTIKDHYGWKLFFVFTGFSLCYQEPSCIYRASPIIPVYVKTSAWVSMWINVGENVLRFTSQVCPWRLSHPILCKPVYVVSASCVERNGESFRIIFVENDTHLKLHLKEVITEK